jgi:IS30 family transposase
MPGIAHEKAKLRHSGQPNKLQINSKLNAYVLAGLQKGWSPEQISGRMKLEKMDFTVCHESIYRYIFRNKNLGLYKLLPTKIAKRRVRCERDRRRKKPQMTMRNICFRTKEADLRGVAGHWEGDTIRFPRDQKASVTTLVERKSRFVCLRKNKNSKSETVINHIYDTIKSSPKKIWGTLTLDQGSEFMEFRKVERQTKCKIFFCDPHSPWQRGSNENMNGRLRRYLPKKFKIDKINQRTLDRIAIQINDTPRKCLGYKTPEEVIKQHWKGYCRTSL